MNFPKICLNQGAIGCSWICKRRASWTRRPSVNTCECTIQNCSWLQTLLHRNQSRCESLYCWCSAFSVSAAVSAVGTGCVWNECSPACGTAARTLYERAAGHCPHITCLQAIHIPPWSSSFCTNIPPVQLMVMYYFFLSISETSKVQFPRLFINLANLSRRFQIWMIKCCKFCQFSIEPNAAVGLR